MLTKESRHSDGRQSNITWCPAFAAGIGISIAYITSAYAVGPVHSRGMGALVALAVPFVLAFPVGWKTEAPDLACIGLGAGFMAPTILWFIISRSGEDLGVAIGSLLMSLIIVPGAVFGIGCATVIKNAWRGDLKAPTMRGYVLIAFMGLSLFLVTNLGSWTETSKEYGPITITQAQSEMASAVAQPRVSDSAKKISAHHYLLGINAFQRHEYETAAKEWRVAVKLDPDNADAHRGLERLAWAKP